MTLPSEFSVTCGSARLAIREGLVDEVSAWLGESTARSPARSPRGSAESPDRTSHARFGRGTSRLVALRDGGRAYVKWYRHGGWFGTWLGNVYWQRPPRPWRELVATEAARRAGVLAPEVLAAAVLPVGGTFGWLYRGALVTRELPGRRALAAALEEARSGEERRAWIAVAWRAIARLHEAGVRHPDLNVGNLLVGRSAEEPIAILDFDRAVVGRGPVGRIGRAFARRRLARSVAKLGLSGLDRSSAWAMLGPADEKRA